MKKLTNTRTSRTGWLSFVVSLLLPVALASHVSAQATAMTDNATPARSSTTPRPAPRTPDGHPDLSGVWNGPATYLNQEFPNGLPYTSGGLAAYQYNMTQAVDPQSLCILIGQPRADNDAQPFEIVQTPKRIAFLYERDDAWRIIPVDGRQHPKDPERSFFGDAIGSWDGDTFVVDIVGFKGNKIWSDNVGHPQSDALHVVERWSRPDADHLQVELTFDDSKYYSQPIKITRKLTRQPYELIEFSCDENNIDREHLGPGLGTKDGTRGYDKKVIQNLPPPTQIGSNP